jgi:cytochrome d ubiquinol oxidase subunit I
MEFQFGTNWAAYSRFVGDIFGAPLAAEGIFAFFLESSFLGILLYGKDRVSSKTMWFSSLMVAIGATISAFWIIVANSWQQTPAGFHMVNGRAELLNIWEAVFNPSTMPRYLHAVNGTFMTGAFFVMGISALYLLKKEHVEFAKKSFKTALIFGFFSSIAVLPIAHWHAVQVNNTQPAKLAAFEGLWETGPNAPLLLFGLPNAEEERTDFAIGVPSLLSYLVGFSPDTVVKGLKDFPADERPPVLSTFFSFHFMITIGSFLIFMTFVGMLLLWTNKLFENRLFLKVIVASIPLPFLVNEAGWMAAEIGRQPWIVQGLLKTSDAVSVSVPAWQLVTAIAVFTILYAFLAYVWLFLIKHTFKKGPANI